MATSQSTIEFLLDQLRDCGPVTVRKMFGEYCLYFADRPIGLVCDNQLFLKPTAQGRALMTEVVEGVPYPRAKPHFLLSADQWDERESLCHLVRVTAHALSQVTLPAARPAGRTPVKPASKQSGASTPLNGLPNLGPKSRQMLAKAGVLTLKQLTALGSVPAYVKVKRSGAPASLNLLWALEGALTGLSWQVVAREHRTRLLLALEQYELAQPTSA